MIIAVALSLGAGGFAQREYDRFVKGNGVAERDPDPRTAHRPGQRWATCALESGAVRIYDTQRLRGTGAGTYQPYYFRYRAEPLYVADAHSLYLQSLAELGVVGFALIVVVVLAIAHGPCDAASAARGRALYAALFAIALAWAVHQAFDWDWQMPAVTLGVFILAGCALARPRGRRAGFSGLPASRTLVALGWLVLAIAPLLVGTSYARLHQSARDLAHGRLHRRQARGALLAVAFGQAAPGVHDHRDL